jgi:hypothetical protein
MHASLLESNNRAGTAALFMVSSLVSINPEKSRYGAEKMEAVETLENGESQ